MKIFYNNENYNNKIPLKEMGGGRFQFSVNFSVGEIT